MLLPGAADGGGPDVQVASPWLRGVVRHPFESLSVPGLGGGTLVDAATWGGSDALVEVIPLVRGGGVSPDTFEVTGDGVVIAGPLTRLPGGGEVSGRGEVRWVASAEDGWIAAEGADALRVTGTADLVLAGGALWSPEAVYAGDGPIVAVPGGWEVAGERLWVASAGLGGGTPTGRWVSGEAPLAEVVAFADAETQPVAWLVATEGRYEGRVPDAAAMVRAEAAGHASAAWRSIDAGGPLPVGPEGWLTIAVDHGGHPRPVGVRWVLDDREPGTALLPAFGGRIAAGAGDFRVEVVDGDGEIAWAGGGEVPEDDGLTLSAAVDGPEPVYDRVLFRLASAGPWRGEAADVAAAASAGAEAVVLYAEDRVPVVPDGALIPAWAGQRWTSASGAQVWAWPLRPDRDRRGYGALSLDEDDALEAFLALQGGESTNRRTVVDLGWLDAIDADPWEIASPPDLVYLSLAAGQAPNTAWTAWFRWLDAGRALVPLAEGAWVTVPDARWWGPADVERGLLHGALSASSDAGDVGLRVAGVGPGDVAVASGLRAPVWARVRRGSYDHGALIGRGGEVLATFDPASPWVGELRVTDGWLIAAAWSDDGRFVASGPVWVRPPP